MDVGTAQGAIVIDDKFSSVFASFQSGTSQILKSVSDLVAKLDALHTPQERTKTDAEKAEEAQRKSAVTINTVTESYRRLVSQLDPVVAGTKKYEDAHRTLSQAVEHGVISHHQYESALDKAKEKFLAAGGGASQFEHLLGKITELTSVAGPAAKEAAEKIGLLGEKAAGVTELVSSLGPLTPILLAVAAAVAVIGIAWKGFELASDFLKEAIKEGAEFEQTVAKLNNTLKANGSASGLSAHEILEFAESLSVATARPTAEITKGLAVLTQFQKIGHDTFERASRDILDYAQQVGTAPEEAFQKFGRALEGGQRGLRALEEVGGVFRQSQKATLRQMLDNGDVIGYQTLLLKILEEHVKGAAAAYEKTFNGQVAQAKNVLIDLKESIANQVLPALEDLVNDLVGSVGGWEMVRAGVKDLGKDIGEFIRSAIYHIGLWYHEWEELTWRVSANVQAAFGTLIGGSLDGLAKLFEFLGRIPGIYSSVFSSLAVSAKGVADSVTDHFVKGSGEAMRHVGEETLAIATLTTQYRIHRTVLDGDTEVQNKHASSVDSVAGKVKDLAATYDEVNKALQAYSDKLSDQEHKLSLSKDSTEALLAAAKKGLYEYALEKDAQDRLNAVTAQTITLDREHRTEIEALTAAHDKLIKLGKTSDAASVSEIIKRQNDEYVKQRAHIAGLVNDKITLANRERIQLAVDNEEKSLLDQLAISRAKITDAENGNTDATRKLNAEIAAEKDRLALLPPVIRLYFEGLRDSNVEAIKLLDTTKGIAGLRLQAQFDVAVSNIDSSLSSNLQQIEAKYLDFLRSIGRGSIDEGTRLLQDYATAHKVTLDKLTADIKAAIGQIDDARTVARYRNADKTPFDVYVEERANIERLMSASEDEVHLTVSAGQAAILKLEQDHWHSVVSTWAGALQTLGSVTGGFIAKLAQLAQILQNSQSVSSGVSSGVSQLGGSSALSGGAGAIAGEVYLVYAIKAFFEAQWEEEAQRRFGAVGEFIISNMREHITQLDENSAQSIRAIRQVIDNFAEAIGGTVTDLAKIGIQVRNDGKAFAAYVEDKFLGYFASADEAIKAAVTAALQDPKSSIRGLSDLVRQGLAGYNSSPVSTLDDLAKFLTKLREISDLGKLPDQIQVKATLDHLASLTDALLQVRDVTPAVAQGFLDLAAAGAQTLSTWRDSITGTQRTAYEIFERSKLAFNAERDSREAALKAQYEETKARLLAAGVTVQTTQQIVGALASLSAASGANYGGGSGYSGGPGGGLTGSNGGTNLGGGGGTGGPNIVLTGGTPKPVPGKDDLIASLKALLDSLLQGLADLPAKITEADFRNPNASNFYAKQLDDAVDSFRRVSDALAKASETSDQFASDLASALSNVAQSFIDTRDAITGHTRSAVEELEIKKQQAALFNAELPLEIANLKAEVAKDQALLATAGITNTYAATVLESGKAVAVLAQITAQTIVLTGQLSEAEIEATQRKIDALNGVIQVLEQIKPIDISEIHVQGGGGGSASGKSPAQELAAFFAAFDRSLLPQLSQQIYDINKKYDDEIKLHAKDHTAIDQLNKDREAEIALVQKAAREVGVKNAQSFIDSGLPGLVTQINGVHNTSQGLIDSLRALNSQGALSTQELHRLVPAIRAAEQAQVAAIKGGVLQSIDDFAATIANQGLPGQLKGISDQSTRLRDALNALAAAGTLSADEFFKAAGKISDAAKAQEQTAYESAATSLLSELYGFLHDDTASAKLKFDLTLAELQIREAELENAVKLYGLVGDFIPEIKTAIDKFKAAGPGIFSNSTDFTDPATILRLAAENQANAGNSLQSAAQALSAAIQKLSDYGDSLLTNSTLSALTPADQLAEARAQLQADYSLAKSGNLDAINAYQGLANTFLGLSKAQNVSNSTYGVDFKLVLDEIQAIKSGTGLVSLPTISAVGSFGGNGGGNGSGGGIGSGGGSGQTLAVINLDPVVLSIGASSNRNHDDLSNMAAKVGVLTEVVRTQQDQLTRVVSVLEHGMVH